MHLYGNASFKVHRVTACSSRSCDIGCLGAHALAGRQDSLVMQESHGLRQMEGAVASPCNEHSQFRDQNASEAESESFQIHDELCPHTRFKAIYCSLMPPQHQEDMAPPLLLTSYPCSSDHAHYDALRPWSLSDSCMQMPCAMAMHLTVGCERTAWP